MPRFLKALRRSFSQRVRRLWQWLHVTATEPSASAPADRDRVQAEWFNAVYEHPQGSREYWLYLPAQRAGQVLPLVVMLHGCTQTAEAFAQGTRMNEWAEQLGFAVLYPQQGKRDHFQRCWRWYKPKHQQRLLGEPVILASLIESLLQTYPFDKQRVYMAGFSAGAAMTGVMAKLYPDLIQAIGMHSGVDPQPVQGLFSAWAAMKYGAVEQAVDCASQPRFIPCMIIQGAADTVVNAQNGQQLFAQAEKVYACQNKRFTVSRESLQPEQRYAYQRTVLLDPNQHAHLAFWLVDQLGHAWAGGTANASYTDAQAPDATAALLDFWRLRS